MMFVPSDELNQHKLIPRMTYCTSTAALSTAAAAYSHSPISSTSAAAVRLFSLNNKNYNSATSKIVHFIRHAEGTHNLNEEQSKLPLHFDATLTPKGIQQCKTLAQSTVKLNVDAVLVSPLTRCLETARISFPHLYDNTATADSDSNNDNDGVPFIAHEEWRETVNFLCDSRRTKQTLIESYPRVNFDCITHDIDPIWKHYEEKFGCYKTHTTKRESDDASALYERSQSAWKVLLERSEKNLALVGHSAFFRHNFMPYFEELEGLVEYGDEDVRKLMCSEGFENCELRSIVVDMR